MNINYYTIYLQEHQYIFFLADSPGCSFWEDNPHNSSAAKEIKPSKKVRWSDEEKSVAYKYFSGYLSGTISIAPSAVQVRDMMKNHPLLFAGRNVKSIKTWLSLKRKK